MFYTRKWLIRPNAALIFSNNLLRVSAFNRCILRITILFIIFSSFKGRIIFDFVRALFGNHIIIISSINTVIIFYFYALLWCSLFECLRYFFILACLQEILHFILLLLYRALVFIFKPCKCLSLHEDFIKEKFSVQVPIPVSLGGNLQNRIILNLTQPLDFILTKHSLERFHCMRLISIKIEWFVKISRSFELYKRGLVRLLRIVWIH
jgi:hypothetical protein